jgi:hypothetical protein
MDTNRIDDSQHYTEDQNFAETLMGLLAVLLAKMISVWYFSSRNVSKGFPFDSFLFNVFDRFTDYLITYHISGYPNIYFPPTGATLGAPPYGHVQFALLKYLPFRDNAWVLYGNFLFVVAVFTVVLSGIYKFLYPQSSSDRRLKFLVLLVVAYPLHFIIDRGNVDIYGAVAIASIYGLVIQKSRFSDPQFAFLLAFLISLKPSFALFAIPLVLGVKLRWAIPAVFLVAFNYLVPYIFYGQPIDGMWKTIVGSQPYVDGAVLFCHSFQCAHEAMGIKWGTTVSLAILIVFVSALLVIRFAMRKFERSEVFSMLMTSTVLLSLMFNLQSWDYRLTFLLPVLLARPVVFPSRYLSKISSKILTCSFVVALGYVNILFPNSRAYPTIVRFIAISCIFGLFVYVLKRKIDENREVNLSDAIAQVGSSL